MPEWNIRRYGDPPEGAPYPLEYAFHLSGKLQGQHVLALGCGEGLDTVILGALGAPVTAVDISANGKAPDASWKSKSTNASRITHSMRG